jgi:hypothetical protein
MPTLAIVASMTVAISQFIGRAAVVTPSVIRRDRREHMFRDLVPAVRENLDVEHQIEPQHSEQKPGASADERGHAREYDPPVPTRRPADAQLLDTASAQGSGVREGRTSATGADCESGAGPSDGGSVARVPEHEENDEGESPEPAPRHNRVRRHDRRPRRRGRGDGGVGVREPRRPAPSGDSDAVELDSEDEVT